MFGLRSTQGRVGVAILVLLVLLGSVAVLATWRTQEDLTMSDSLGHRSAAATAVEKARAESLRSTTLITAAVFAEDATPFVDSWRQANAERDKQLSQARLALTDLGDTDALAALNSYLEQTGQTAGRVEAILDFAVTADVSTRIDLGRQQFPLLWDETRAQLADLDELANDQEAKLAAERAARDSSAETTLVLILGLSAFAFLGGTVALSGLFMSVVRPLAALRTSARAVAAGDLEARATVAGPEEVASLARDFNEMVAQRGRAEEALRESETRFRQIFESFQDMYFRTDAQGIIAEISPSVERWGYSREALIGTQVLEIYEDPEERSGLLKKLMEQGEVTDYEIRLKDADGHPHADSLSCHILRDPDGTFIGTEGIIRDISERKRAEQALRDSEEALHEQARRDPLTGVLNHGAIVDEMRGLISTGTGEHGAPWAVAMIDVDRLKVANDAYGHQVGDAVLVAVAAALSRSGALVGRYGGDEFVAILPAADKNAAERYRKDATDALARATITDPQTGATMHAEASIGLAIYPEDGSTIADLIKVSDNAMYAAKRQRPFRRPSPHKRPSARKAA